MLSYVALSLGIILAQLGQFSWFNSLISVVGLLISSGIFAGLQFRLKLSCKSWFFRLIIYLSLAIIGFSYANLRIDARYANQLTTSINHIELSGYLISPVTQNDTRNQAEFKIVSGSLTGKTVLLAYPLQFKLNPGYIYQLSDVSLKPIQIAHNFAAFDYQEYMVAHNISAFANIYTPAKRLQPVYTPRAQINLYRSNLITYLKNTLDKEEYAGLLIALVTGYQKLIPTEQWKIYQKSGIIHIVSISGLHITLVTGLTMLLANFLLRYLPPTKIPRQIILVWVGIIVALAYSLVAGFGIPTQRAFYLLLVIGYLTTIRQKIPLLQKLAMCLAIILLIDPFACLSNGFWFSFVLVATIFVVTGNYAKINSKWRLWLQLQIAMTLISLPLSLYLFNSYAWVSFFTNLWAIPLLGNLMTPLILVSSILHIAWLIKLCGFLTGYIMIPVTVIAKFPAYWQAKPDLATLILTIFGICLLVLPLKIRSKNWLGAALFGCVFMVNTELPIGYLHSKIITFTNSQVGFALIQTQKHNLLLAISQDPTQIKQQFQYNVLPYLYTRHINQIDWLVTNQPESELIRFMAEKSINITSTSLPDNSIIDGIDLDLVKDKEQLAIKLHDQKGDSYLGSGINAFPNQNWQNILILLPLTKLDWLFINPCDNLIINPFTKATQSIESLLDNLNLPSAHTYNLSQIGGITLTGDTITRYNQ